ncbi:penicillin-binding protein [Oceaniovalibus guishaninsula JLT2003]|uniref:peptidoglycan glycosyltransferase n=1 Tax=Oceaniovalibus guishaninsula JLT2003 TaxID=1231392 RepID=K2HAF2_9RHOB|nr:PBP1A family penicillin-binding protein [Oceaniovalibus guishaninsula]EKE44508.1 penicillin-binding protein [Oceaniovalibus guishaninsula JLT2003]
MATSGKGRSPLVAPKRTRKAPARPAPRRRPAVRRGGRRRGPLAWIGAVIRWAFRLVGGLAVRGAAVLALILGVAVYYFYTTLPPVEELLDGRARGSVTMLDRDGAIFAWRGEQFGGQIDAATISPNLRNAVIATEDRRFYRHFGVSPRGVASAVAINLREGRGPLSGNGGSTITQQTAKLLCLGVPYDPAVWETEAEYEADCREGSLWRKVKEAVYAMAMEAKYSKNEILTIYLNRAFLGAGSRGFEAAAQRYFGKSANQVTPAEGAMLAGLLVAPTRYAPTNDLQRSQDRASVIIGLMEREGYLTPEEVREARAHPAELSAAAEARAGGYFADWVMTDAPDFLTRKTTEDVILRTTFDPRIQRAAESALDYIFDAKVREGSKAQAAIVVMSADGAVRAMVGGRKFKGVAGQFNRAIMAKRQTGSAFKPFVYAAALELGYSPNDRVMDAPLTLNIPGSGPWSPRNYTGEYRGEITLTEALEHSINTAAVRVSEAVGRENVRKVASDFGIDSDLAAGPALALGASESTLLEMTGAYAGILNGGSSVEPYGLVELRLKGNDTPLIGQTGGLGERVISQDAAQQLTWMMSRVIEAGTGQRARLPGREAAGKTGTTQASRDAWFVGFTADYVAGVWMGYDDNTPLKGVTGGGLPAEIWQEAMSRISEGLPARPLPMAGPRAPAMQHAQPYAAAPVYGGGGAVAQSGGVPARGESFPDAAERLLQDVLGGLFGR